MEVQNNAEVQCLIFIRSKSFSMALKWGIAGASKISHDFCTALKSNLTIEEHQIIAIASRSKDNADKFANEHDILHAYGSYLELAQSSNIEIVYVAVLNPQHYEVTKLMLEHGKNVLCEKPFAMNSEQVKVLITLAAKQRLFIAEGLWSRFFPVYRHLSELLEKESFGDIREIYVRHGFSGASSERIIKKQMGGGIVLDIGCYAIQLILFVYREAPKLIRAEGKVNAEGVDLYFQAELTFSENRKAFIICSGLETLENQATIITTKGPVCIPNYWCPTQYIALGNLHKWELPSSTANWHYTNSMGLKYEADEVKQCIRGEQLQCAIVTPAESLLIANIQDEIRKQIGVQYDCDAL